MKTPLLTFVCAGILTACGSGDISHPEPVEVVSKPWCGPILDCEPDDLSTRPLEPVK